MEILVHILIIAIVPAFQLMMVRKRIRFKTGTTIGNIALLCFGLSFCTAFGAVSIGGSQGYSYYPGAHEMGQLLMFFITLIVDWLFNLLISLIGLELYKAALEKRRLN